MPTLPVPEEAPSGPVERLSSAAHRAANAVGADARVHLRALLAMVVIATGVNTADPPWAQVSTVALVILALDWARTKGR